MVADDILCICLLHCAVEIGDMEETFVSLCVLRTLFCREKGIQFSCDKDCIEHFVLGVSRVDVAPLDVDLRTCSIEVLILKLANLSTIESVGIFGPEFFYVEVVNTASDLLVRGEADLDIAVFEFRMGHDILYGCHNLCHTGFVICAEQGSAVCSDDGVPFVARKFGEILHSEVYPFLCIDGDVLTIVILDNLRFDTCARCVRGSVYVGDKAKCRDLFPLCIRWD